MAYGCIIRDANGNEIWNLADRLGRILGAFNSLQPTWDHVYNGWYDYEGGIITNNGLRTGTPFWMMRQVNNYPIQEAYLPTVTFNDNMLIWRYDHVPAPGSYGGDLTAECLIIYGVF